MTPRRTLAAIAVVWTALTLTIALVTAPWEANDEPDHAQNAVTLAGGHWYRITPDSGLESHQAPLYYLALAGWHELAGIDERPVVRPPRSDDVERGFYRHDVPQDARDTDRIRVLRLLGLPLGLLMILLTAAAGRRVSRDPWTPVVAAGLVAAVPKVAFVSAVVTNDVLANALGAAAVLVGVVALQRRPALRWAAVLGLVFGALVLTKVSTATIGAALLGAAVVVGRGRGAVLFGVAALAVCGWWLVQNQIRYGSPLASDAAREHLEVIAPGLFDVGNRLDRAATILPRGVFKSFWYTSGWHQFKWALAAYAPLWLGLAAGLVALAAARRNPLPAERTQVAFLAAVAAAGVATVWIIGLVTNQTEARIGHFALPAIALLWALGLERARVPLLARFALPLLGLALTAFAVYDDVLGPY